jgi:hypothetical protein
MESGSVKRARQVNRCSLGVLRTRALKIGCVPTHAPPGPGLREPLRFGLRRLYELRLDVDYDAVPISRASAETGTRSVQRTLAEIDHRT